MTIQAQTNTASVTLSEEAVWGETPGVGALAPRGYQLRFTGETVGHDKMTVTSAQIRSDRQRDALSEVGVSAAGDLNFELAFRDFEMLLGSSLANLPTYILTKSQTSAALAVSNANVYTGPAGTGTNIPVGANIRVDGFTSNLKNNGHFLVTASASATVTVDPADSGFTTTAETSSQATTIKSNKWTSVDIAATTTGLSTATSNLFTTTMSLAAGQWIRVAGFVNSANNGLRQIASFTGTTVTFTGFSSGTIEAAGPTVILTGKRLSNGIIHRSFRMEKFFSDIGRYHSVGGIEVNETKLTLASQALVTGSFAVMGKSDPGPSGSSALSVTTPSTVNLPYNATANVGTLQEGGATLTTAIKNIDLTIQNNLRARTAVANKAAISTGFGFVDVTGTLNAYFEDDVMYQKFLNHTQSSLTITLTDAGGNTIVITLPRIYYTKGPVNITAGNEDVMVPLEFTALRDPTTNLTIAMDFIAA
jgi:hypothetical protein